MYLCIRNKGDKVMNKILYWLFGKPQYYYDPELKGGFRKGEYLITIYRYWMGKRKPVVSYADTDPTRLLKKVRKNVEYRNEH